MQTFDFRTMKRSEIYRLMTDVIVPRPIAWITTESKSGQRNLAPFSYFNGVSSEPPALSVSITDRRDGTKKDTLRNIEETREFVVNSACASTLTQMHQTSAEYPYGVDEMEKVGLHPISSLYVKPPRLAEAPVQMECTLLQIIPIGRNSLVIGTILAVHISEAVLRGDRVDIFALDPLARLGGHLYGKTREVVELDPAKS